MDFPRKTQTHQVAPLCLYVPRSVYGLMRSWTQVCCPNYSLSEGSDENLQLQILISFPG